MIHAFYFLALAIVSGKAAHRFANHEKKDKLTRLSTVCLAGIAIASYTRSIFYALTSHTLL